MKNLFVLQTSKPGEFARWQDSMRFKPRPFVIEPGKSDGTSHDGELSVVFKPSQIFHVARDPYGSWMLQDKVESLLHEKSLTGWFTRPVSAVFSRKTNLTMPRYGELLVTGWGGLAPEEAGIKKVVISVEEQIAKIRKIEPKWANKVKGGYEKMVADAVDRGPLERYSPFTNPAELVDEAQWDGSDLFRVWPVTHLLFVTEDLVAAFHQAKISGVGFIPIEKLPVARSDASSGYALDDSHFACPILGQAIMDYLLASTETDMWVYRQKRIGL